MKLRVKNSQITEFYENAEAIIGQFSRKGVRNKYISVMQRMFDELQDKYRSIQRGIQAIRERNALVNNSSEHKEFILGPNQSFTYNKDGASNLAKETEDYLNEYRDLSLDVPFFKLEATDLPSEGGNITVSNQIIKVLCPFIITKELKDKLLYGDFIEETKVDKVPAKATQNKN